MDEGVGEVAGCVHSVGSLCNVWILESTEGMRRSGHEERVMGVCFLPGGKGDRSLGLKSQQTSLPFIRSIDRLMFSPFMRIEK